MPGLAYNGVALTNQGVAIGGHLVKGIAGAGNVVYNSAAWRQIFIFSVARNAISSPFDSTGANLLVVGQSFSNQTGTMTDTYNNTWQVAAVQNSSRILYAFPAIVGTQHQFQVTGGSFIAFQCAAYAGAGGPTVRSGFSSGNANSAAAFVPDANGCLFVSHCCSASAGTFTAPDPYTVLGQTGYVAADHNGSAFATYIQPVAASLGITWGGTAVTKAGTCLVAFRPG